MKSLWNQILWASCLVGIALLSTAPAPGQDYRAKVQGSVSDPSQAKIAGAKVLLKNINTGVESSRETDSNGTYIFDFVVPGTYSLTVEASGFQKYIQENIVVQTRGDVTINAQLVVGGVAETVTVTGQVSSVQFNSATMTTMVTGQLLKDLPVLARNPFTLALLNPAVINRYWDVSHRNPFYMWSNSGMDVGGNTGGKNDQLLDGVPLGYAARGSYNASMDAVQEVQVQQNAVDAEFGFSAGGTLNLSMKSGTNEFHGSGYYFGRNPYFNALQNRITRTASTVRNHNWGGTLGNPILKNKLFSYFSYEQWKSTQPQYNEVTLPTDAERTGDFSKSLTKTGGLRTIYDPFTTQFDPATATVTRMPFAGNIIPANRINPTGQKIIGDLPKTNGPGDDLTGINNRKNSYYWWLHYWNISERVDYNINDKWRMYARYSKYQTRLDNPNWGGTIAVRSDNGGIMDALNAAADVLYIASPNTTIDFRYGAIYLEDEYDSDWAKVGESAWANLFPTGWYKPVLKNLPGIYYPSIGFSGNGGYTAGLGSWWQVRGRSHTPSVTMTHDMGKHHMKAGWQLRYSYDYNGLPAVGNLAFNAVDTGNTFVNFNPSLSGNMYASALLGTLNSGNAQINPMFHNGYSQWGLFFQDDIKLTQNITLNLGMRWETEQAPKDDQYMFSRYLDLTNPIPELQGGVQMPAEVTAIAKVNYKYNGAWMFTDSSNPRAYKNLNNFLPRAGIAVRINDKSALRFGYARYAVPMKGAWTEGLGSIPTNGFSQATNVLGPVQGVPQTLVSDPFPSTNPLITPIGQGYGRYQDLGNNPSWFNQNLKRPINDRVTISYQRELPWNLMTDSTFFMNYGHNQLGDSMWGGNYGYDLNQIDPQLYYTYKGAMDAAVPNPFYQLLPANKMPGSLRNQKTVSVATLLRPYPQYPGGLTQQFETGISERYKALQIKVDRRFAQGLSMTLGYNYNHESKSNWFNQPATYANDKTLIDMRNPRHTIRMAGTWELPIGRGRPLLKNVNRAVDLVVGGWATSHIFMWNQGSLLYFGQMNAPANSPSVSNPTRSQWFDTAQFSQAAAYTPRTNPWFYDNLRGPGFWSLDSTLVKYFPITERLKLETRFEFFNLPNVFMPSDPDTSVTSSTFGKSTGVAGGNYGREVQYTLRLVF
ncbi:MAG: carboxypeptidase regulatory-like domain-containing protein [Bryobacterales bacterium]|nr:carboxypeptidase regulatory-like domain-containing protein [Bryobacterales bacterium]